MKTSRCFALVLTLFVGAACATQGAGAAGAEPDASYVYFDSNVDTPIDGQDETLAAAARALDADPWLRAVIVGHTDADGEADYNRDLAFRRATEIQTQLEALSESDVTDRTRLAFYGEDRPLADNASEEGKAKNRRVQIYFFHPQKNEGDEVYLRRVFGSKLDFSVEASAKVK